MDNPEAEPDDAVLFVGVSLVLGIASRHLLRGTRVPYTVALLVLGVALGSLGLSISLSPSSPTTLPSPRSPSPYLFFLSSTFLQNLAQNMAWANSEPAFVSVTTSSIQLLILLTFLLYIC
jgi:hypothetical protein